MTLREMIYTILGVALMFLTPWIANVTLPGVAFATGISGFGLFCLGVFCNKEKDEFRDWARQRNKQV